MDECIRTIPSDYEELFELPHRLAYKVEMGQDGHLVPENSRKMFASVLKWVELDLADAETVFKTCASTATARDYVCSKTERVLESVDGLSSQLPQEEATEALARGLERISHETQRFIEETVEPALAG